jgi:hypothetical protein
MGPNGYPQYPVQGAFTQQPLNPYYSNGMENYNYQYVQNKADINTKLPKDVEKLV